MNRSLVLAVVLVGLGISAFACGGKVVTDDSGSLSSKQKGDPADLGDDDDAPVKSVPKKPTKVTPPSDTNPGGGPRSCSFGGGSASGDGNGYCETTTFYTCANNESVDFTCRCKSTGTGSVGQCSCGDQSFEFDCSHGCAPTNADYAKCNLPSLGGGGGGGSSTSSSG